MRQVSAADVSSEWPVLEPIDGCRERPIALNKPVCVAGDRARVNLTLSDATVSRAHAIFVADGKGVYLRDLASLNHVFVNEEPVREASLQNGDVLKIGPYAFRCQGGVESSEVRAAPASTAPAAELRTPDEQIHVPLDARRTTLLGSRDDCDVKMAGGKVSPAHAVIFEMRDRRYIRDLRSVSGTFVNGRKVGQAELHPGDEIRIGDSKLIYSAAPAQDPDGTLTGILAEDQGPTMGEEPAEELEAAPKASAVEAIAPEEDLEAIPLMDDSDELRSLAREFAEEKEAAPAPAASPASDSSIIPLLDESEFAPGIAPDSSAGAGIPAAEDSAIPLADDSLAPAPAPAAAKPAKGRKRDASEPKRKRSARPDQERATPSGQRIR